MTNWEALVATEGQAVWRTLWHLLGDRDDAEECFQETFVAALRLSRRQTVQCWPATLCRLATARAMDALRKRYRRRGRVAPGGKANLCPTEAVSSAPGPTEQAVAAELSERLRGALAQIAERQAEVFSLHALCGWSHREIAARLDMTDNAVAVMIHRARQRLRALLSEGQRPDPGVT